MVDRFGGRDVDEGSWVGALGSLRVDGSVEVPGLVGDGPDPVVAGPVFPMRILFSDAVEVAGQTPTTISIVYNCRAKKMLAFVRYQWEQ